MKLRKIPAEMRQRIKSLMEKLAGEPASAPVEQANPDFMQITMKKEINDAQIGVDAAALGLILKSAGYTNLQALDLLARMYGGFVSALPKKNMIDGAAMTPSDIQEKFFVKCMDERRVCEEYRAEIISKLFPMPAGAKLH